MKPYAWGHILPAPTETSLGAFIVVALASTFLLALCPLVRAQGTGTIYVSDYQPAEVQSFLLPGGTMGMTFTGITKATGLAFDTGGNLYMASSVAGAAYISKSAGGTGTPQQWYPPCNPTCGGDRVLGQPHGIAFDALGNLFVATAGGHTVVKIPVMNGVPQTPIIFADRSVLVEPFSVAFDSQGNVYVADGFGDGSGNNNGKGTIVKFNRSGTQHRVFAPNFVNFNVAYGLAIDGADNVYVTNQNGNTLFKFKRNGVLDTTATFTGTFDSPLGLALDGNRGNIYVANLNDSNILKFPTTGGTGVPFAVTDPTPHFLAFKP